ncbi:hypothetical protein HDU76_003801 [Blyttiomyces sp. JEL0837]|nr:hypothetical protein HDU76_003801 [Blyttiomyces sp. JEL0837]
MSPNDTITTAVPNTSTVEIDINNNDPINPQKDQEHVIPLDDKDIATKKADEENVILDQDGNPIKSHTMTKDKKIRFWAVVVLIILVISWGSQWAAFALPYWRSDKYHNGGLFQICGNYDWVDIDVKAYGGAGDLIAQDRGYYKCQTIHEYMDTFLNFTCSFNGPEEQDFRRKWCLGDGRFAEQRIGISRWFEATSTSMSMFFGITTLWLIVFPNKDPKICSNNGVFALIGIFLTPWLCVIDFFISVNFWDEIGVGFYDKDPHNFLAVAGQTLIGCTFVDLVVQLSFLRWGIYRHNWKVPTKPHDGDMGGSRAA